MNDTNRRAGIGSSDAPVIAGLSPWRTPVELFMEKRGMGTPQEVSIPMRAGTALEGVVLDLFTEETGLAVTDRQRRFVDPTFPVRWATVDGMTEDNALIECKTTSSDEGWGTELTDEIPAHYVLQTQHAMICTQAIVAWVPVLIGLREFRLYKVLRDDRIVAQLTDMEKRFWSHVQSGTAPPLLRPSDLRLVYPADSGKTIVATPAVETAIGDLVGKVKLHRALGKEIEVAKAVVQGFMEDAATLTGKDDKVLATWKNSKAVERFDAAALKVEQPDIWKQYKRAGASVRSFLIKGVKDE